MNPPSDFQTACADLNAAVDRIYEARSSTELGVAHAEAMTALRAASNAIARAGYPGAPERSPRIKTAS